MNGSTELAESLITSSPILPESLRNLEKYQSERPIGNQETERPHIS